MHKLSIGLSTIVATLITACGMQDTLQPGKPLTAHSEEIAACTDAAYVLSLHRRMNSPGFEFDVRHLLQDAALANLEVEILDNGQKSTAGACSVLQFSAQIRRFTVLKQGQPGPSEPSVLAPHGEPFAGTMTITYGGVGCGGILLTDAGKTFEINANRNLGYQSSGKTNEKTLQYVVEQTACHIPSDGLTTRP